MLAMRPRHQRAMDTGGEPQEELADPRRRIEVLGELAIDLEWTPIAGAPFVEGRMERLLLFVPHAQGRATTLRVQAHVPRGIELEPVLTRNVVKLAAACEFERVGARAESRNHRADVE